MENKEALVLRPSKKKHYLSLFLAVLCAVLFVVQYKYRLSGDLIGDIKTWMVLFFLGLGVVAFPVYLLGLNNGFLRITAEGFEIRSAFYSSGVISWADVQGFDVRSSLGTVSILAMNSTCILQAVVFNYDDEYKKNHPNVKTMGKNCLVMTVACRIF